MRRSLHAWVRRWWRGEAGWAGDALSVVLAPAEALYAVVVHRRNRRFDRARGHRVEGLRIVSVGNLTVGGTGKTPLAAWAARLLAEHGVRTAVAARGYGRDELLLHARWNPDVPVLADPNRVRAAERARDRGAATVVLDDGFQHRGLVRDVDVVLVAAEDPFPGRLLPRGPYREPHRSLERAHAVVVTRRTATAEHARGRAATLARQVPAALLARVALVPERWTDLAGADADAPAGPVLAVTAVARPEAFVAHVREAGGEDPELLAFPDHHAFSDADVRMVRERAGGRTVAVTEKDAVKLLPLAGALGPSRVLRLRLSWEEGRDALESLVLGQGGATT